MICIGEYTFNDGAMDDRLAMLSCIYSYAECRYPLMPRKTLLVSDIYTYNIVILNIYITVTINLIKGTYYFIYYKLITFNCI